MHKRIKRITSHSGHARYLAEIQDCGWIPRDKEIPSPYHYSPTHFVSTDSRGRKVFVVETAHKTYDVFDCSQDHIFASDAEASESVYPLREHSEPTRENQLWHARNLLNEKGRDALNNPHGMIGRTCGCGECFCCAAVQVLDETEEVLQ